MRARLGGSSHVCAFSASSQQDRGEVNELSERAATAKTYGQHLTLRIANVENRSALNGAENVRELLTTLVRRIGMRILAGPLVGVEDGPPDHQGVSGVVILYESHAAIHTYPEVGQAFLDVFSCKPYDVDLVKGVLSEFIGSFDIVEKNEFDRGIHWSTSVERELTKWQLGRN